MIIKNATAIWLKHDCRTLEIVETRFRTVGDLTSDDFIMISDDFILYILYLDCYDFLIISDDFLMILTATTF